MRWCCRSTCGLADIAEAATQRTGKDPLVVAFTQSVEHLLRDCEPRLRAGTLAFLCHRQTLTSARSYLFLDALDEVPEPAQVSATLHSLGSADCRVLLTSRPYAYAAGILPWPDTDLVHYTMAPFTPTQRQQFIDGWFQDDAVPRERLSGILQISPRFNDLTSNALLLSLTCTAAERHELAPHLTRGELYELIIRDTLRGLWRPGPLPGATRTSRALNLDLLLSLLAQIAFMLFQANPAGNRFRTKDWHYQCQQALGEQHLTYGLDHVVDRLSHCGLLVSPAPGWYAFLHRSFFEYLTAYHLVERAEQRKWPNFLEFVDKKAWDPNYQEVIVFLTGQLEDPQSVLKLLGDARKDDYFHHRLAVAAQCLPEIRVQVCETQTVKEWIDQITTRTFSVWWKYNLDDSGDAVSHLTRAFPAMGLVNGQVAGVPLLTKVREHFGDADGNVRRAAVQVVWALRAAAATPVILAALAERLGDADADVRQEAAVAVGALGVAATPALIAALVDRLGDADADVRQWAILVVRALGLAAATPAILAALAERLVDADEDVRTAALWTFVAFGEAAVTPALIATLVERLDDADKDMRRAAAVAVKGLWVAAAATPATLATLAGRLGDTDKDVRYAAVRAVEALGAAAATPAILVALAGRLGDTDEDVRQAAAVAAKALGTAATPAILVALAKRLGDAYERVQGYEVSQPAVRAVKALGPVAATPAFLAALAKRLRDTDRHVRMVAVEAVEALGAAAATPAILAALAERLGDAHRNVRLAAIEAVKALGAAAATPAFLAVLAERLGNTDEDLRWISARAVEALRSPAATPAILAALAKRLGDTDWNVRQAAVNAVEALGGAAATPAILAALAERLGDADVHAVNAVEALGAAAATPAILVALAKRLGDADGNVRRAAVAAVEALGSAAATPAILAALAGRLGDTNEDVRQAAVNAVEALGSAAATPAILAALAKRLRGADGYEVSQPAVRAVKALGSAAATPAILVALAGRLGDTNEDVRRAAAVAAKALGTVATPAILVALAKRLGDADRRVRREAETVVASLTNQGIRLFKLQEGGWQIRKIEELSRMEELA